MSLFEPAQKHVYSVSQFTAEARRLLETEFPIVWVDGELSNLGKPGSGHWYFTLKDDRAQVRCAMFANRNRSVRFRPTDGMRVIVRGRVSLYEPRGDFQIIAEFMEPAGEGALRAAFDALQRKLADEGLFAVTSKVALPRMPRHLAVISSPTGAALRDVLAVLGRRCPSVAVTLLPVSVQGRDAEAQINAAFARLAAWPPVLGPHPDVVLLARGGGSLEDLQAFNAESVARSIAACTLPVVVGVGHETDVTIADLVADVRAPTPSAGAELIAPDLDACAQQVRRLHSALVSQWQHCLRHYRHVLQRQVQRLVHPGRALQQQMQRTDELERRLAQALQHRLQRLRDRSAGLTLRLRQQHPAARLARADRDVAHRCAALQRAVGQRIAHERERLRGLGRALHGVSPLDTLSRGYAIAMQPVPAGARWGKPISSVSAVTTGAPIAVQLRDGRVDCTVDATTPESDQH